MIISKPEKIDRHTVGCIITYKSKYLLLHRIKDNKWGSIAGSLEEHDKNYQKAINREIKEELSLNLKPKYFTTTYHRYGSKNMAYHLFEYEINKEKYNKIKLLKSEIKNKGLFSLKESLKLNLFEDESYCLMLHKRKTNFLN